MKGRNHVPKSGGRMMSTTDLTQFFNGGFLASSVAMSPAEVSTFNAAMDFERAATAAGLVIKHGIEATGRIVRCATVSKPKKKNGWYVFYPDGIPAGSFGDYETGIATSWCARSVSTLSLSEQMENRKRMEDAKKQREEERKRNAESAIQVALDVLARSSEAPADHPYVTRKAVRMTPGIKINGDGELLIPMHDETGELCSIQRIYPDGEKKNWYQLPKGIYEIPGSSAVVYVCEGWATGATLAEATGSHVYVAFDTGNLKRTAEYARKHNPTSRVILAADNDQWHADGSNPGVKHATDAAALVGGQVIVPNTEGISGKPTDWNDIHVALGIEEVRKRLGIEVATIKRQFELIRIDSVEIKEIDWIVEGYLEADALGLAFGEPGKGKSFVAIDMALCVATGKDWHGCKTKQGAVIYIAGEGHSGFARRARAWAIHNNTDLAGVNFYKSQRSCQLFDIASAHEVADSVRDIVESTGQQPSLIVVDTVARNMGGDENSTPDMARFVEHLDALLRSPYKAHVLLVHHSGKASPGQARGSTVLRGALDQEYMVDMDDSTKMITLTNKKMKDGEIPLERRFNIKQVGLGIHGKDGKEILGAALETVDISGIVDQAKDVLASLKQNQRKAILALEAIFYRRAKDGMEDSVITVEDWKDACKEHGISDRRRFYDTRDALIAKNLVNVSSTGIVTLTYELSIDACPETSDSDENGQGGQHG